MAVVLSDDTQAMIEAKMRDWDFASVDELVQTALTRMPEVVDVDELDEETRAAIAVADQELAEGKGRPWDEVREELKQRFGMTR